MQSPYIGLADRNFWKTGVSSQSPESISDLWRPKFTIPHDARIATAGSCFAQHISRYMRARGYGVLDVEPPPPGLSDDNAKKFGYSIYSARYGNIYTVRHLLQLTQEAFGLRTPAEVVWEKNGRFYDALRPSVEPNGLASGELVLRHRNQHLQQVKRLLTNASIIVFTLGLTEGWIHRESGTVFPTAPGTIAGSYDPDAYAFKNFDFPEIYDDFVSVRDLIAQHNPSVKFLLTVSPVPLTATASDQHVLVATTYSKSVLRAVAGKLASTFENVDYFPSYEIIASPFSHAKFYSSGLRAVTDAGVETVMRVFFGGPATDPNGNERAAAPQQQPIVSKPGEQAPPRAKRSREELEKRRAARDHHRLERQQRYLERQARRAKLVESNNEKSSSDVVCEDILLDAFSR